MTRSARLLPALLLLALAVTAGTGAPAHAGTPAQPAHAGAGGAGVLTAPANVGGAAAASTPVAARADDPRTSSTVGVLVSSHMQCSATVVTSDSKSVITTAAHCVYLDGRWRLDRMQFLPGYHDGRSPYGAWDVEYAWVPAAWQDGDGQLSKARGAEIAPDHDVAFARLRPDAEGRAAQDVLGSQGIRFDTRPGEQVSVFGYDGTGRNDGPGLRRCTATPHAVPFDQDRDALATDCGFTPGASGGPWLTGEDAGRGDGWVSGVTSLLDDAGRNYVATFGAEAQQLYTAADRGQQ